MRYIRGVLFLSSALVIGSSQFLSAQPSDQQTVVPFKAEIVEAEGKEWSVISVELPAGMINSWHSQPRGEFLYVLEGAGRLEVDGKPAITLNPGSVSTLTSIPHHVLKNMSRTKTLKILVVFLNEHSEPHPLLASSTVQAPQSSNTAPHEESKPRMGQHKGDIGLVF